MADIAGPGGTLICSGFVSHFQGWSASLVVSTAETTGFVDVGNRTFEPTALMMSGSFVGTPNIGQPIVPSAGLGATPALSNFKVGTLTLGSYTSGSYTFPAVITAANLNRPSDGKMDAGYNFVSNGAITQTNG